MIEQLHHYTLLLLAVSGRKRVGFSLILLCKNRFAFRSELAKSKKSIVPSESVTLQSLIQDSLTRFLMSDLYKKCRKHIQVKSASMVDIGAVLNAFSYRDVRLKYGLLDGDW